MSSLMLWARSSGRRQVGQRPDQGGWGYVWASYAITWARLACTRYRSGCAGPTCPQEPRSEP